eukprot:CAMPEP_0170593640 /NCGR_PEP_ID=MMETSP0224-20130122/13564_1 /TAXON_ID=285029 /ORGANISM="Togula jolla, Strain CCCM 725" /LENGTH=44 /DNA_ID= /DNA_START= /DNA_END= /DNA_ORIENTATION=
MAAALPLLGAEEEPKEGPASALFFGFTSARLSLSCCFSCANFFF